MDLSSMSDADLQAIAGQAALAQVSPAILGQESGSNPNVRPSIDGAIGQAQIMPSTFAQYAKPGEDINNPADNLAVHQRIIQDLSQKAGGDPARIAVGYFSGPGNIAPADSPTPWKQDRADGNGKSVSSYVSDILGRINPISSANAAEMPLPDLSKMSDAQLAAIAGSQDPSGMGAQPWSALHIMSQPNQPIGSGISSANGVLPSGSTDNSNVSNNQQGGLAGIMQALSDKPDMTYGNILPFAKNEKTGDVSLALPQFARSFGRGIVGMAQDISGEGQQVGSNLNPDELSALAMISPTSVAGSIGKSALGDVESAVKPKVALETDISKIDPNTPIQQYANAAQPVPENAAQMGKLANASYKQADDAGGKISPQGTNKVVAAAEKILPQSEEAETVLGSNPATEMARRFQTLKDKPLSLATAQELDEGLSDAIDSLSPLGKPSKQAVKLMDIQNSLRDVMHSPAEGDTLGGTAGFDALAQGRAYWTQMMKMRDLERIQANAALMDVPATSIRSGVRAILKNPNKANFYSPDEIVALKKAASAGIMGEALRGIGSRLTQYAAGGAGMAAGGPIAGAASWAASHAVSGVARNAAESLQNARVASALQTIAKNTKPRVRK